MNEKIVKIIDVRELQPFERHKLIIILYQIFFNVPYLALIFPSLMIFAVMSRDVGLVLGGKRINQNLNLMVLAYVFLFISFISYIFNYIYSTIFLVISCICSIVATGLPWSKGRIYPLIHLNTAWL